MSSILSCDFWFCCGSANDDLECWQPPQPPYAQQTQVVMLQAPSGQQMPPPPPMPTQTLPPTIVYNNIHPPSGTTPSPPDYVPSGKAYHHLPPPYMEQPAWRFAPPPPAYAPYYDKGYNVPQSVGTAAQAQLLPMCHSVVPSEAYHPLPQSTQMIPSHHQVPFTNVHEPSNTYQSPSSFTNQQWPAPAPRLPSKRHETVVPMHAPTPAASNRTHDPMQQSKQTALSRVTSTDNACDKPPQPQTHMTSEPTQHAVFPARQLSNKTDMNQRQQSIKPPPVPSKSSSDPPVQVHDPWPQPKTTLLSCVPSTKAHHEPPPAQAALVSSPQHPPQLTNPQAPSRRYEIPTQTVGRSESSRDDAKVSTYSEAHHKNATFVWMDANTTSSKHEPSS